jgi:hypothetical protein
MSNVNILFSSIVLFVVTFSVIFGIFKIIQPSYTIVNTKFDIKRTVYISMGISFIFTLVIVLISNKVDAALALKNKK